MDKKREEIVNRIRESSKVELSNTIEDMSIPSLIKYLKERSRIHLNGRANTETRVNKEALRLAAVYLQEYLDTMNGDI